MKNDKEIRIIVSDESFKEPNYGFGRGYEAEIIRADIDFDFTDENTEIIKNTD